MQKVIIIINISFLKDLYLISNIYYANILLTFYKLKYKILLIS